MAEPEVDHPRLEAVLGHGHQAVAEPNADVAAVRNVGAAAYDGGGVVIDVFHENVRVERVAAYVFDPAAILVQLTETKAVFGSSVGVRRRFDLMQVFAEQEVVGLDQYLAGFLVFGDDFRDGQDRGTDVRRRRSRQRTCGIEEVRRVLRAQLDAVVVAVQGNNAIVTICTAEMIRLDDAIGRHGEINELFVELVRRQGHMNRAGFAVAVERE